MPSTIAILHAAVEDLQYVDVMQQNRFTVTKGSTATPCDTERLNTILIHLI